MSERGVFAVDRGVFDHPLFDDGREPLTKREAWLWMLAEASWRDRQKNVAGALVTLQRGQLLHSIRFMAQAWRWSKSTVARFLDRLEREKMVVLKSGTPTGTAESLITICNYNAYQRVSLPSGTASGTQVGQHRDKLEGIEGIEVRKGPNGPLSEPAVSDPAKGKRARKEYPADFEAAWLAYPRSPNMSKAEALSAWQRLSQEDRAKVLPSIPSYAAYLKTKPDLEVIHFCRYLSKRRFEGYAPAEITEADWSRRLVHARIRSQWATREWGPKPGAVNCRVPAHLLQPGDGEGWADRADQHKPVWQALPAGDPDAAHYRGVQ